MSGWLDRVPDLPVGWVRAGVVAVLAAVAGLPWLGSALGLFEVEGPPTAAPVALRPELVWLPGGTFRMGSGPEEQAWARGAYVALGLDEVSAASNVADEAPHEVTVGRFAMCRTEVTQGQWESVMGSNPSDCDIGCGAELPVQKVSWFQAVEFLNRVSAREGLVPCYAISGVDVRWDRACTGYRLPTESEWEYAARAGTETAWSWGAEASEAGQHAWYAENAEGKVHPVGTKQPNPWGLHDVHGNVWEWAWDWYGPYDVDNVVDNGGAAEGEFRVVRGGSFGNDSVGLRSANRAWDGPADSVRDLGFRCARSAPQR